MKIKQLNELGQKIFEHRYAYPGETKYSERCKAMAKHMASAEKDEDKESFEKRFYEVLSTGDFVPGGRIIFGSGRSRQNMLNCYVLEPEDSVDSIGKVIADMYKISCAGGGIGFNFSKIRPRGDDIQNIKNSAPGAVSVMRMINEIGNHVRAGKNRRTALMAELNVTHPDILEFLKVKLDLGELTNFNISVAITNRFIEACEKNEDWYFTFNNRKYFVYEMTRVSPDGSTEQVQTVALDENDAVERVKLHQLKSYNDTFQDVKLVPYKAMELWDKIWENSVKSGDPGIFNIDLANEYTNVSYFERMNATNPSLRGDTLVLTKKGAIPIKEIADLCPDNEFYTFDGNWAKGYCRKSGENKTLWKITFSNGKEVYCTPEHKWPILVENPNYKRDGKQKIDYSKFVKKETKDISKNDKIYLPSNLEINNIEDVKTRDEGFTLGWNLGDGWRSYHKLQNNFVYGFIFSKEDHDSGLSNKVSNFINTKFSKDNKLRENKGCFELYYGSKSVSEWFESLGHYGKESGIPLSVWRSNKEFILGFIDGLFSSDGFVSKDEDLISLTTVHKNIASDVQKLLLMFGISSVVRESIETNPFDTGPSAGKPFSRFNLSINGIMAKRFSDKLTLSHEKKNSNLTRIREEFETSLVTSKEYLLVESVEKTDIVEDVWDITVYDSTHTFAMETGVTSNCGEITLPPYGNCCLGNINLANMADEGEFDWKRLAHTVRMGVRFLDNVLTVNHYPIQECNEVGQRSRRIGLGVLGLHYMFIKLGIKYGSEKSLEFLDRLFSTIRDEAYKASVYLARDKSPFPAFNYKLYLQESFAKTLPTRIRMLIKDFGIRNAVMLTVPPTGTISMVHGVSSGIEPIFAAMYMRRYRVANTWAEEVVLDPLFKEYIESGKPLDLFVGAYDVSPEEHIKVQATIQKYIDNAISKTINLPSTAEWKDIANVALKYAPYLKGLTVYRSGSRGNEPLQAIPLTQENIEKYAKPTAIAEAASAEVCRIGDNSCGS